MARNRKKNTSYPKPVRLRFPDAEDVYPCLSMLLDAYDLTDNAVFDGIARELMKKGRTLACTKGCSSCCKTHVTIPVYPPELLGIYWYIIDSCPDDLRKRILDRMKGFMPGKGCPFLLDGACGIHPLRPMACRFFNVFNKACEMEEDPFYTRRNDVLTPDEKMKGKAMAMLLPYYGIVQRAEKKEAIRNGYLNRFVKNLQDINWQKIAESIINGDRAPLTQSLVE